MVLSPSGDVIIFGIPDTLVSLMPAYPINFPEISYPALFLICVTGLAILSGREGRWLVLALGLQYVGVFLLVFLSWSVSLAAAILIAGWISAVLLGLGLRNTSFGFSSRESFSPTGLIFRLLITIFIIFTMYSLGGYAQSWFSEVGMEILLGSLFLLGMGMLQLGLTTQPFRVVMGLLIFLSGFIVLYAALENAVLVAGLLAILILSLGVLGVYFLSELASGDVK